MGVNLEEKQECDHPSNHEIFHDPVTGEDIVCDFDITKSVGQLNGTGNCKWFKGGKHKANLGGRMSDDDKEKLRVYQEMETKGWEYRFRPWWKFW
jgi:hypothetical protein